MKTEEKVAFVQRATITMAEYTHPFTASIVGTGASANNPHVGTAFRLQGASRRVVTAAHVVREGRHGFGGVAVTWERGNEPRPLPAEPVFGDDELDIAVFAVEPEAPEVACWPEARCAREDGKLAADYLFVHGFPKVRSGFSALLAALVNRSLPYGVMLRDDDLPGDMKPFQFAMDFDPANFASAEGGAADWIDPHGLSGSPVWRIGAAGGRAEDWSPEKSELVGVVTQWKPDHKCLVATRWSAIADKIRALTPTSP